MCELPTSGFCLSVAWFEVVIVVLISIWGHGFIQQEWDQLMFWSLCKTSHMEIWCHNSDSFQLYLNICDQTKPLSHPIFGPSSLIWSRPLLRLNTSTEVAAVLRWWLTSKGCFLWDFTPWGKCTLPLTQKGLTELCLKVTFTPSHPDMCLLSHLTDSIRPQQVVSSSLTLRIS